MKSENITQSWIVCHKHTLQEAHFLVVLAVSPVNFSALVKGFITLSTSSTHTNLNKLSLPLKRSLKTEIQKKSSAVCGSYTASSPNNQFTFKIVYFLIFLLFLPLKKKTPGGQTLNPYFSKYYIIISVISTTSRRGWTNVKSAPLNCKSYPLSPCGLLISALHSLTCNINLKMI